MEILVSGATGNVGRNLVNELLQRGAGVRALTRRPAEAGLPDSVTTIEGSLAEAPARAFEGVDAAFVFPAESGVPEFVEGAVAAGVGRFVVMSSLAVSGRHERDAGSASAVHHAEVEQAVKSRTDQYSILRPGNFAGNLLFWAFAIKSGWPVRAPYINSSQVLLHEKDVALAAAVSLLDGSYDGSIVELTGPQSLTKVEQLATISAAIGRDIGMVEISPDEFRSDMSQYMPAGVIDMLLRYWSETVDEPEVPLPLPPALSLEPTPLAQWGPRSSRRLQLSESAVKSGMPHARGGHLDSRRARVT